MTHQILSIDTIQRQAIRAADSGQPADACPYKDKEYADRWLAAYMARNTELRIVSTFAGGAVEQLEEVGA
jgi:ribosome modulation factor